MNILSPNNISSNNNGMSQQLMPEDLEKDSFLDGVNPALLTDGCRQTNLDSNADDYDSSSSFGLPLVISWRSFPPEMESAYRELVSRILPAFTATSGYLTDDNGVGGDINDSGNNDNLVCNHPEAHIFPFEDLHITVATFRTKSTPLPTITNNRNENNDADAAQKIRQFCIEVIQNASTNTNWPKEGSKLRLKPKAIRMSRKNAIILWEDTSGNMEVMRHILKEQMKISISSSSDMGMGDILDSGLAFDVPPIVHSTFLRLWKVPLSNPKLLLESFSNSEEGKSSLMDILLPLEFEVDVGSSVTLVHETTPCMHVDYHRDETILWPIR